MMNYRCGILGFALIGLLACSDTSNSPSDTPSSSEVSSSSDNFSPSFSSSSSHEISSSGNSSSNVSSSINLSSSTVIIEGFSIDEFDGSNPLLITTAREGALPNVSFDNGTYLATLTDNTNNITLHYHQDQGRLDAALLKFPFEFIARNIGIGTVADPQVAPAPTGDPFSFAGVQVHSLDLDSANSSHVVVGHRGNAAHYTVEGKNTLDGNSNVNDNGPNTVPDGRADIRIVGNEDHTLTIYWQTPRVGKMADQWNLYGADWDSNPTGTLPGNAPAYGDSVYVGLITYAYGSNGVPFVGTCDRIEVTQN